MATKHNEQASPLIAIIGAGPGGLLLASYLQQNLPPAAAKAIKIYESDPNKTTRAQGGTFDLRFDTGLYAIKSVGLYKQFKERVRQGGEEMRVVDAVSGEVLMSSAGSEFRPEIDRADLRDILINSLLPDTIQYGHHLESIAPSPQGKAWNLNFRISPSVSASASGSGPVSARILVGADGAWSKVRPLITPVKPVYCGMSFLDMDIQPETIKEHPELADYVGQGLAYILSGTERGVVPQRNTSGVIKVYGVIRCAEDYWDHTPLEADPDARRDQIRAWFPGFAPKVLALMERADMSSVKQRKLVALPPELTWARPSVPANGAGGLTALLGDSAHVMSPFAGEGVNLAMRDAVELGKALAKGIRSEALSDASLPKLNSAPAGYEMLMFRRAKEAAIRSESNMNMCFAPGSPQVWVDRMKSFAPPGGIGLKTGLWWVRTIWREGYKYAVREGYLPASK